MLCLKERIHTDGRRFWTTLTIQPFVLPPESAGRWQAVPVEKELGYFARNIARMQYGTFRKAGFFIGSGVVEAGCKNRDRRPVMAGYCETEAWDDAVAIWLREELPGISLLRELFDHAPAYYTTEFAKAPPP